VADLEHEDAVVVEMRGCIGDDRVVLVERRALAG